MTSAAATLDTREMVLAEILPETCTCKMAEDCATLTVSFTADLAEVGPFELPDGMGPLAFDVNSKTISGKAGTNGNGGSPVFRVGSGTTITITGDSGSITGGAGGVGAHAFVDSSGAPFAVDDQDGLVRRGAADQAAEVISNGGASTNRYDTLQAALANVGDAGDAETNTVRLIRNVEENVELGVGAVILDLNGKTLTGDGTASVITINTDAALTLTDDSTAQTGRVTMPADAQGQNCGGVWNDGTFAMTGGAVKDEICNNGGTISISGGLFGDAARNSKGFTGWLVPWANLVETTDTVWTWQVVPPPEELAEVTVTEWPARIGSVKAVYGGMTNAVTGAASFTVPVGGQLLLTAAAGYELADDTIDITESGEVTLPTPTAVEYDISYRWDGETAFTHWAEGVTPQAPYTVATAVARPAAPGTCSGV